MSEKTNGGGKANLRKHQCHTLRLLPASVNLKNSTGKLTTDLVRRILFFLLHKRNLNFSRHYLLNDRINLIIRFISFQFATIWQRREEDENVRGVPVNEIVAPIHHTPDSNTFPNKTRDENGLLEIACRSKRKCSLQTANLPVISLGFHQKGRIRRVGQRWKVSWESEVSRTSEENGRQDQIWHGRAKNVCLN